MMTRVCPPRGWRAVEIPEYKDSEAREWLAAEAGDGGWGILSNIGTMTVYAIQDANIAETFEATFAEEPSTDGEPAA